MLKLFLILLLCLQQIKLDKNQKVNQIFQQKKLLLEQRYSLNKSLMKWVSVGLDPSNFQAIIYIHNTALMGSKFTISQWNEFLSLQQSIKSYFWGQSDFEIYYINNHEIRTVITTDIKMIAIKSNNYEIFLGESSCMYLLNTLQNIISSYLKFLYSLNLIDTFREILLLVISLNGDMLLNIKNNLNYENIKHFAIREIVDFYPDIVLENIKEIMFSDVVNDLVNI